MDIQPEPHRSFRFGAIAAGLILLALGTALLLDRTGTIDMRIGHLIAPLVLIVLGATIMFERGAVIYSVPVRDENGDVRLHVRKRGNSLGGFWLIGIGAWMLISQNHLWGLSFNTSWPLFIVFVGLMMVIRGWR